MKPCNTCVTPSMCGTLGSCQDKDTVIEGPPLKKYWITFGFAHHMGPEKQRLARCYTIIKAPSIDEARRVIYAKRGLKYASTYETEEAAGVEEHALVFIEFDGIKRQEGDNL